MGAGHAVLPIPEMRASRFSPLSNFAAKPSYSSSLKVNIIIQWWFGLHRLPAEGLAAISTINGIAALREIQVAHRVPRRGEDAVRMLRTLVHEAHTKGRVCIHLEPIALYMTKDLHQDGDGLWLTQYPEPSSVCPLARWVFMGMEKMYAFYPATDFGCRFAW